MTHGGDAPRLSVGRKSSFPGGARDRARVAPIQRKIETLARARMVELLEKSSHREKPPCPYFFECGGCQWQQIRYESQVSFKSEILKDALQRIAKIPDPKLYVPILSETPLHYRNRIRLQVSRHGEVGFFKTQSKEVVEIDRCLIAEEALNEKIPEAKILARSLLQKERDTRHEIEILQEVGQISVEADPAEESPFAQVNESQNQKLIHRVLESLELKGEEKVPGTFAGGKLFFSCLFSCERGRGGGDE